MKKHKVNLLFVLGVTLFHIQGQVALAESKLLSYDEVLQAALENSPFVAEIEAQSEKIRADGVQLKTLSNPELSGEVRPYVSQHNNLDEEYEIGVLQPLRLSSFGMRERVGKLIEESASIDKKLALLEFSGNLRLIYLKTWALQEKEKFTKNLASQTKSLSDMVQRSTSQGLFPASISKLFEAELEKLSAELIGVSADHKRALAELLKKSNSISKEQVLSPIDLGPLPKEDSLSDISLLPVVDAKRLRLKIATAQRELSRLDSFPKFAPRIAFEHTSDGADRVNVGFQIEIPLFDRNQGERIKSDADERASRSAISYVESGKLQDEVALILEAAKASSEQAKKYKEKVIPTLAAALSSVEREFKAGQGNPQQVFQNVVELRSAQDTYLELVLKALSERIELSVITGKEI